MKVAVMGYGTVGSGVCEVIETHQDTLAKRTGGKALELARILDLREFPGDKHEALFTKDFNDILNDPEIQIVAETMGGVNPAFDFTMKLLASGKSVVTSNKELVAQKGPELLACAKAHNVNYLIEASVGGGIPIIRPMAQCLAANHIEGIAGILNGTTNFILTQMIEEDMSFADALALAQANGFAEKDPTADVEGHDACRKVCILASLAFGKHVYPSQVETEGISKITLEDVAYVASAGGVIKLLGQIKDLGNGKIAAFVGPAVVYNGSQLASVKGVFNAVLVRGDAVGDVCFYGQGAGKLPTASAVVADMADCAAHTEQRRIFGWGADVEGHDACRKVCILASLAFGKHVYPSQVETEGISKITLEDVAYVASAGGVIKLLGQIKDLGNGKIAAFVGPAVVYNGSQLASVKGVFNAVLVRGDAVGDVCFYGQGAGKLPTASAVVADMADCAAHTEQRRIFGWGAGEEDYVVDYKTAIKMPFYVRVQGDETHIKQAFDNVKFLSRRGQPADEKAFITDEMTEEELERRLAGFPVEAVIKVASY